MGLALIFLVMIIEEPDFRLTSDTYGSHWDVEVKVTVRPRNGEPREDWKVLAYGCQMPFAIRKVMGYRLEKKKETYTLKEFMEAFKTELDNIKKLVSYAD